jgi:hypothetical protein
VDLVSIVEKGLLAHFLRMLCHFDFLCNENDVSIILLYHIDSDKFAKKELQPTSLGVHVALLHFKSNIRAVLHLGIKKKE